MGGVRGKNMEKYAHLVTYLGEGEVGLSGDPWSTSSVDIYSLTILSL